MAPLPPPPPPPPPLSQVGVANKALKPISAKPVETRDVNALLSQIRQGAKLKKVAQVNDRSAPLVTGSNKGNTATSGPITPSMFKNGQGPLNIALALKSPQSLKPTGKLPRASTVTNSATNNSAINNSATNNSGANNSGTTSSLAKKPTISKSPTSKGNTERPSVKPPPLPMKPPGINRRQSFDSGQLRDVRSQPGGIGQAAAAVAAQFAANATASGSSSNFSYSSATLKPMSNKPPPPPRSNNTTTSTSNLTSLNNLSSGFGQLSTKGNSYSSQTLKPAPSPPSASGLKYKSAQNLNQMSSAGLNKPKITKGPPRPLHGPPPPPPPKGSGTTSSGSSSSLNSTSGAPLRQLNGLHLYDSSVTGSAPSGLAPAPLPPSPHISGSFNQPNRSFGQLNSPSIVPVPPTRNTSISKNDLETRFYQSFKDISMLPAPEPLTKMKKQYPSVNQSKRRNPAPLPPTQQGPGASGSLSSYSASTALMNV